MIRACMGRRMGAGMKTLSEAEWNIMESLWEESPKVGSRIVADMAQRVGWSRSTTLTMLKRMTKERSPIWLSFI